MYFPRLGWDHMKQCKWVSWVNCKVLCKCITKVRMDVLWLQAGWAELCYQAEASNSTKNISHYNQTSIFLSVATGNEVQCFTAAGQITCDDIYQLSELQINHLSLFLFLWNKLRSETWFQAVKENLKTHYLQGNTGPTSSRCCTCH